jgi:para-aminobenzoate synthetase/4-amino-4-deoxychorismate lyase
MTFRIYGHPLALYARLRARQPVRYGGYVEIGEEMILSFSPELFFERHGSRVLTRPMKGTAPRGRHPEREDEKGCEQRCSLQPRSAPRTS